MACEDFKDVFEVEQEVGMTGSLGYEEQAQRNQTEENDCGYHGEDHYHVGSLEEDREEKREAAKIEQRCQCYAERRNKVAPRNTAEDAHHRQKR